MKALSGLVVSGGESSRMGMDKSLMVYHQKSQRYYLYDMLKPLCKRVFISCNKKQSSTIPAEYEKIVDMEQYENIGPMAALLSAFTQHPDEDLLVIACDYPFIKTEHIQALIDAHDGTHMAVSYFNPETNSEEPLLAIYSIGCYPKLLEHFIRKEFSLKQFLRDIGAKKITPPSVNIITSIDTPEAYHEALTLLKKNNGKTLSIV